MLESRPHADMLIVYVSACLVAHVHDSTPSSETGPAAVCTELPELSFTIIPPLHPTGFCRVAVLPTSENTVMPVSVCPLCRDALMRKPPLARSFWNEAS